MRENDPMQRLRSLEALVSQEESLLERNEIMNEKR